MKADIRAILSATNFTPSSGLALGYVVLLPHRPDARLVVVNAFKPGPEANVVEHIPSRTRRDAKERLRAFVRGSNCAGVPANCALMERPVPNAIVDAVNEYNADLLVLGTQGALGRKNYVQCFVDCKRVR